MHWRKESGLVNAYNRVQGGPRKRAVELLAGSNEKENGLYDAARNALKKIGVPAEGSGIP